MNAPIPHADLFRLADAKGVLTDVARRLGGGAIIPYLGSGIAELFKANTRAVLVEAPGSQSFEMPDVPAIASVAHARGATMIDDNTWATPLYHRSLEQGVKSSLYVEEMFATGHDAANREVFAQFAPDDAKVVGIALRAEKKVVDKITKGAKLHP